jgi:hypothetical protein
MEIIYFSSGRRGEATKLHHNTGQALAKNAACALCSIYPVICTVLYNVHML